MPQDLRLAPMALCLLVLHGCATYSTVPVREPLEIESVFEQPFDEVWAALVSVVGMRDEPLGIIEKDSGILGTDLVVCNSAALHEVGITEGMGVTVWSSGRYSYKAAVFETYDGKTQVNIKLHVEGFGMTYAVITNVYGWYVLQSRGTLERRILREIETRLYSRRPDPMEKAEIAAAGMIATTGTVADTDGQPSASDLDEVIGLNDNVMGCFLAAEFRDQIIMNPVKIRFRLHPDGDVTDVEVLDPGLRDTFIAECLTGEVGRIRIEDYSGEVAELDYAVAPP